MNLVWKLLRENISKKQLIGFAITNFIGLSILLLGIQFYFDVSPLFNKKDALFKQDYLTISKTVSIMNSLGSKSSSFSNQEIKELEEQSFVKKVGPFIPSQFSVFAGFNDPTMNLGFNTEMFFESVPDEFVDIDPQKWKYSEDSDRISIILPQNYLDLYNFGFAESKSMPKLTEGLIQMVDLDITLYVKNKTPIRKKGQIVGFSNRINTILVPQAFMDWANQELVGQREVSPSRLIVEVNNIADPNLSKFFEDKGYQISGDNTSASKMAYILKIVVAIVVSIGIVICLLSFFVLVLSIYLILEKNMSKLTTLRLIGYSKSMVVRPYEILVVVLNTIVLICSLVLVFFTRAKYLESLKKVFTLGDTSSIVEIIFLGLAICLILTIFNIINIRRKVK